MTNRAPAHLRDHLLALSIVIILAFKFWYQRLDGVSHFATILAVVLAIFLCISRLTTIISFCRSEIQENRMTLQRIGWRIFGTATAVLFIVTLLYAATDSAAAAHVIAILWLGIAALIAVGLLIVLIGLIHQERTP